MPCVHAIALLSTADPMHGGIVVHGNEAKLCAILKGVHEDPTKSNSTKLNICHISIPIDATPSTY